MKINKDIKLFLILIVFSFSIIFLRKLNGINLLLILRKSHLGQFLVPIFLYGLFGLIGYNIFSFLVKNKIIPLLFFYPMIKFIYYMGVPNYIDKQRSDLFKENNEIIVNIKEINKNSLKNEFIDKNKIYIQIPGTSLKQIKMKNVFLQAIGLDNFIENDDYYKFKEYDLPNNNEIKESNILIFEYPNKYPYKFRHDYGIKLKDIVIKIINDNVEKEIVFNCHSYGGEVGIKILGELIKDKDILNKIEKNKINLTLVTYGTPLTSETVEIINKIKDIKNFKYFRFIASNEDTANYDPFHPKGRVYDLMNLDGNNIKTIILYLNNNKKLKKINHIGQAFLKENKIKIFQYYSINFIESILYRIKEATKFNDKNAYKLIFNL